MKRVMVLVCLAMAIHPKSSADLRDNFRDKKIIKTEIDYKYFTSRFSQISSKHTEKTKNYKGHSSYKECSILPLSLLDLHHNYPSSTHPVVVDLGSGYGACAKQMAVFGYEVYSIDEESRHIDKQEEHFCTKEKRGDFLDAVLSKYGLTSKFEKECEDIKKILNLLLVILQKSKIKRCLIKDGILFY